jgi:putative ABC transport system permease protein
MSILSDALERARSVIFRRRDDRELDEELRLHLEMEMEHHRRAGLSHAEARRRGAIALGGMERVKDDVRDARGTRLVEDGAADIAFTVRTLAHSPGFAIVAILTLAIGIGGTTAVFSAVDAVLLQPLPYQQPGQLVRLYQSYGKFDPLARGFVTPVHYLAYRADVSSFEGAAAILTYDETGADVGSGDDVRRIRLLPATREYFDVLRVHPEVGRGFQREDEAGTGAAVVVLSHRLWEEQLHGDRAAIGRPLSMSGTPYTIIGVMPDGFTDPVAGAVDAWVPMDLSPGKDPGNASNHYFTVIARLRPETPIARAQAELDALTLTLAQRFPDGKDKHPHIYPLKEDLVGGSSRALDIMLGAVTLVLVLVCVNIATLLLVRGAERGREFALRSALGAARSRLVRQMLIESLTLALAGDVAGLIVARIAMSAIVILGSGTIPRLATLSLEPRLLGFSLLITTFSALFFGLAPALRAARTEPGDVLRTESRSSTGGGRQLRLRDWLVVSQISLAFVLLVGAGLLVSSFRRLREVDLGVKTDGVLTFELHLPAARYDSTARARFYDAFAARLETLRGVRAAGAISKLPAAGQYHQWRTQAITGPLAHAPRGDVDAENRVIAGDYFRAVGIPLLAGREFDGRDAAGVSDRVIVNARLARLLYPGVDAIGQRLKAGGRDAEIIGVVGDVSINNEGENDLYVYHTHRQFAGDRNWALTQVVATTESGDGVQEAIRRALAEADPELVMYKPMPLTDAIGVGSAQRLFTLRILATFALVAIVLAALGLFGVLSYGVRLRSREFGIRMALGAERGAIRGMVLRQGLVVTAIGVAVGLVGASALSRAMASALFHVSPFDPVVLAGAVALMIVIAAIAAYVPAYRATAVDPRASLQ